jgi:hypothetical protein
MPEELKKLEGTKRPLVDSHVASRVEQFASKQGISNREAYTRILTEVLDSEGNFTRDHTGYR